MKTKKPKLMMQGHTDEIFTPEYAIKPILPFLKKDQMIWECAWGGGSLAKHFNKFGFNVVGLPDYDFLKEKSETIAKFDIIITNPPYSKKDEFLKKAFEIGKPFAFLLPLTALEGIKRGGLYNKYGIQLIVPNRRINFIMPNKQGGAWFQTAWFCYKMNLPNDLNFVELIRDTGGKRK